MNPNAPAQLSAVAAALASSRPLALLDDAVDVWAFPLIADDAEVAACASLLSGDERRRAARFLDERDASRFTIARGVLRSVLARYCFAAPATLQFAYGTTGKPRLVGALATAGQICFNLSHSDAVALLAVAPFEVGADLERDRSNIDVSAIAGRYFFGAEAARVLTAPPERRTEVFLRHWVAKESVLKGAALGIGFGLDRFHVRLATADASVADVETLAPESVAPDWQVHLLGGIAAHYVAIAARGAEWRIRSQFVQLPECAGLTS